MEQAPFPFIGREKIVKQPRGGNILRQQLVPFHNISQQAMIGLCS